MKQKMKYSGVPIMQESSAQVGCYFAAFLTVAARTSGVLYVLWQDLGGGERMKLSHML